MDAYLLVFVNVATRNAIATSSTEHPDAKWVAQPQRTRQRFIQTLQNESLNRFIVMRCAHLDSFSYADRRRQEYLAVCFLVATRLHQSWRQATQARKSLKSSHRLSVKHRGEVA